MSRSDLNLNSWANHFYFIYLVITVLHECLHRGMSGLQLIWIDLYRSGLYARSHQVNLNLDYNNYLRDGGDVTCPINNQFILQLRLRQ